MESDERQQLPVKLIGPESMGQFHDATTPEVELKQMRMFIDDVSTPEDPEDRFWGIIDKQGVLSNLSEQEIIAVDHKVDLAMLWDKMGKPRWTRTFNDLSNDTQLKLKAFKMIRRSKGGFERMALVTQKVEQKANVVSITGEARKRRKFKFF